jgi:catechol 2,3-dioxygenase-like lactoylglutathione lyase family enzyme
MSASTTLRWFAHANVNTSDVGRGERFYTEVLGLHPAARTAPAEPQDGTGFAMGGVMVQWAGVLLSDHRGGRGPLVDLLQWKLPPTEGAPAAELTHLGLSALRFGVADVESVVAAARRVNGANTAVDRFHHQDPAGDRDVVVIRDADGTRIEVVQGDPAPEYRGVRINCSDLARSIPFYEDAFGLEVAAPRDVVVTETGGGAGRFRAATASIPGQPDGFTIELTEWRAPASVGTPPGAGNHAGIYRVAIVVDDIEASHQRVLGVLPSAVAPVDVVVFDDGPLVRASFYPDPDGAIVELIQARPRAE